MTTYHLRSGDGIEVFTGTITPAPGGGAPIEQDADPGAVGAGAIWVKTTDPAHGIPAAARPTFIRDAANTGWYQISAVHWDAMGNLRSFDTLSDGGWVAQSLDAAGVLNSEIYALGPHAAMLSADGLGATSRLDVHAGTGLSMTDSTGLSIGGAPDKIGFYATAPVVQQAVTGALSAVVDPAAKAVLTSIIAALAAAAGVGLVTDGTT